MRLINQHILWTAVLLLVLSACKKEKEQDNVQPTTLEIGILVLNEGLFQQNNSSVSWINLTDESVISDIFLQKNDRYLGDTGNDMKIYGGKIYIVVNASSTVEILDKHTLKSIKQLPLHYNNQAQQPRHIAFHSNKAYVSSFDGYINVIDTASLAVIDRIQVGANPEGVAVLNNHLYVSNSGGLNFPNVDSTVYEIDLSTHSVTHSYHVGANPGSIVAGNDNQLYVVKRGDYASDPAELVFIHTGNQTVTNTGIPATLLAAKGDHIYIGHYNYSSQQSQVSIWSQTTHSIIQQNAISGYSIQTLYGIHPLSDGRLICLDAKGFTNLGSVLLFNSSGNFQQEFQVGLNPNKLLYYE
jgi:YVTN family beta-propeller protein